MVTPMQGHALDAAILHVITGRDARLLLWHADQPTAHDALPGPLPLHVRTAHRRWLDLLPDLIRAHAVPGTDPVGWGMQHAADRPAEWRPPPDPDRGVHLMRYYPYPAPRRVRRLRPPGPAGPLLAMAMRLGPRWATTAPLARTETAWTAGMRGHLLTP